MITDTMTSKLIFVFLFIFYSQDGFAWPFEVEEQNEWNGKWFPQAEGHPDVNTVVEYEQTQQELHDAKHGIKMGIPSKYCDDGQTMLEQDWFGDPTNYTCYDDKKLFLPNDDVYPVFTADHIPVHYAAQHKCMTKKLYYDTDIPTFGSHRPLWAKYGEYRFIPIQRWLHNLEHGAIVMLYHPCANNEEVDILRQLVVGCLRRHIITPYSALSPDRPLALVAWGRKLLMSRVNPTLVQEFIQMSAKRGPERVSRDGHYELELLQPANIVTNKKDKILCPNFDGTVTMK